MGILGSMECTCCLLVCPVLCLASVPEVLLELHPPQGACSRIAWLQAVNRAWRAGCLHPYALTVNLSWCASFSDALARPPPPGITAIVWPQVVIDKMSGDADKQLGDANPGDVLEVRGLGGGGVKCALAPLAAHQ